MRSLGCIVVIAAACGDNGRRAIDAVLEHDDGRALVRLAYIPPLPDHQRGGLSVIFQAADSTVLLATRTSADGEATALLPPDAYVTLIAPVNPLTNRQSVWTYEGVQPGDELVLDTSIQPPTDRFSIQLAAPRRDGAAYYQMVTNCDTQQFDGGSAIPSSIAFRDCQRGTADILLLTYRSVMHREEDLDAFMLQLGVPVSPGARIDFPPAYQAIESTTVSLAHVDAATAWVSQYLFGRDEWIYFQNRELPVGSDPLAATFRMPLPSNARIATDILVDDLRVLTWQPPAAELAIDVGALALPRAIDTPRFEPTTNQVRWTEEPGNTQANAVVATLTADEESLDWTIMSRRSEPKVQFPTLPRELGLDLAFEVSRVTSLDVRADLDAVRQRYLGRVPSRLAPLVGEGGTITARQHLP